MIGNVINKERYTILSTTPSVSGYSIPFKYWDKSQISVVLTSNAGVETTVDSASYTVTSPADSGTLAFVAGYTFPEGTALLTVVRTVTIEQQTDLRNGDVLDADTLENMFDTNVAMLQELNEKLDRTVRIPVSDPSLILQMPSSLIRANMLLGFDASGNIIPVLTSEIEQNLADALAAEASVDKMYNDAGMVAVRTDMAVPETSKIQAVAANKTNIDTVAGNIANVNIVGGDIANVNAVAGNKLNIDAVNANKANIDSVAANETNINAVNANKTNIDAVAANESDIDKVALNEADIDVVAADLNLGVSSKIKIVAEDKTNIDAVAANKSNIDAVAANEVNIDAVAGNNPNITAVAENETNINAVNANKLNIDAVANDIVAVQDAHANMAAILDAPAQASAANQARIDAQAALADMRDRYLGPYAADPTTDVDGSALEAGDQYYNTVNELMMVYTGTSWKAAAADAQNVGYDGTASGMEAGNLQEAVDELSDRTAQIFGLDWDNATDSYLRTDMAVGLNFGTPDGVNAIASDFDNYYPWKGIKQVKVDSNKNILAYLGDSHYSSASGEYMTLVPQFWFKDWIDGTVRKLRIANSPVAGFKPAFLDKDGKPVEYRLVGRVPAGYDTELRSKPDMGIEVNRTYTSFITAAYAKGDGGWWLDDSATRHKLGLLMAVEAGDWDQKAKFGQGINSGMPYGSGSEFVCSVSQTGATSIIIPNAGATNMYVGMVMQIGTAYTNNSVASNRKITAIADYDASNKRITVDGAAFDSVLGTTSIVSWGQPVPSSQIDALGGGSGYILQFGSEARSHVSYRGIWDLWGNVWSFTYGFARYNGAYYVCFDQSKYNVADPRSDAGWIYTGDGEYFDSNGYQLTRKPFVTDQGSVDYVVVIGGGAGSGTFYAAYVYNFTATYDGVRILLSGGIWYHGGLVSLFFCGGYYTPGYSGRYIGSRLIG